MLCWCFFIFKWQTYITSSPFPRLLAESTTCDSKIFYALKVLKYQFKMPLAVDLLHPSADKQRKSHKLKRLVQHPNSYFMDVKCPGCYAISTIFSHAQSAVPCKGCSTILCTSTGGKARLTEGCSFRRKQH